MRKGTKVKHEECIQETVKHAFNRILWHEQDRHPRRQMDRYGGNMLERAFHAEPRDFLLNLISSGYPLKILTKGIIWPKSALPLE